MSLRTDYSDDVLDTSVNTKRKYSITENADDTISLTDETVYTQEGDYFGADDINATNSAINTIWGYYVLDGWVGKHTAFNQDGTITETDTNSGNYVITTFNQDDTITQKMYDTNNDLQVTRTITFNNDGSIDEVVVFEE